MKLKQNIGKTLNSAACNRNQKCKRVLKSIAHPKKTWLESLHMYLWGY